MTKKRFIALAHAIREHNSQKRSAFGKNAERVTFNQEQLDALILWLDYVNGKCVPGGGKL